VIITVLGLLTLLATACTEQASVPTPTPQLPAGEAANFRFLISDDVNAIDDFASVNVTISQIGVQSGGESGNWTEFTPDITEVDLKPLAGENALEIWSGNLTPGEYSKVFIYVSEVNGILTHELGGEKANVKLPSEKLQISKPFVISANTTTSFVYDVTVVEAGKSGQYILKPQIAQSGAGQKFREVEKEEKGKDKKPETKAEDVTLEDVIWILESFGNLDNPNFVLEDTEVTIKFDSASGQFEGSAGCNSYFGSYEVDEDKLSIKQPVGQTERACLEPIMEQETQYLTALQDAEHYEIDGDQLQIFCDDQLLVFEKR